jgi:3-mercaptopyruvate sulfurtransferase SseA
MRRYLFCFVVFISTFLVSFAAHAKDDINPIVSVDWLQKNLDNPSVFVLDIRKIEDYKKGHIPGALSLTYAAWRTMSENLIVNSLTRMNYQTQSVLPVLMPISG